MKATPKNRPVSREDRAAEALRENLRKRKLQAQNRETKKENKDQT